MWVNCYPLSSQRAELVVVKYQLFKVFIRAITADFIGMLSQHYLQSVHTGMRSHNAMVQKHAYENCVF